MQKNIIITLLFSIVIAVFAILNAAAISVNLIFVTLEVSAALVILISASLGAVLVYFLNLAAKMKLKKISKATEVKYNKQQEAFAVKEQGYLEDIESLKNEVSILETQFEAIEQGQKTPEV